MLSAQTVNMGMKEHLRNGLPNDNPLPLHIVAVADWYDILPGIELDTAMLAIRQEISPRMIRALKCLMAHKADYDWKFFTEEETDAHVVGIIQWEEGEVKVYRHIVAAYIKTDHLKALVVNALKGDD